MSKLRMLMGPVRPVMNLLFPPACWVDGEAADAIEGLSDAAREQIARLAAQGYCRQCGLGTGPYARNDANFLCGRCHERDAGVQRIARVGTFSEPLIGLVHRLKFGRSWEVARVVAPFMYQAMLRVSEEMDVPIDAMVPVPLHWLRRARRGFNQAEELARETARLSGWQVITMLRRVRRTHEQARIDARTVRLENLRGAFVSQRDNRVAGKHVWLIDDVSTTGATIHAAATALRKLPKEMRPASINAAVLCVTDHKAIPPMDTA